MIQYSLVAWCKQTSQTCLLSPTQNLCRRGMNILWKSSTPDIGCCKFSSTSIFLRKNFQKLCKTSHIPCNIKMGFSSKLKQNGGRGAQEFHRKPVMSLPSLYLSSPLSPTSFKLSISLHGLQHSCSNTLSIRGPPGGPVYPILLTQHAWDGAVHHTLFSPDWHGRSVRGPTRLPPQQNYAILTRLSLDPACLPLDHTSISCYFRLHLPRPTNSAYTEIPDVSTRFNNLHSTAFKHTSAA